MPLALCLVLSPALFAQTPNLEELANINFVADVRLFAVMSAINAGGFNYETAASMHPVRQRVRDKLKTLDPALLQRLHDFYIAHHAADTPQREIARYTSLALLLSNPPQFDVTLSLKEVPAEAREVIGFEQILPVFYQQAGLEQLWLEVGSDYAAEIEKYKPLVRQSIAQSQQYLRTEARVSLDRQILFMPDLMSAHGFANSRIVQNLYYLVVGPAEDPETNLRNVRHEYLHFLLDPIIEKNGLAIVQQREVLQLLSGRSDLLEKFANDLKLLNIESLIEAAQLRIEQPANANEQLTQKYAAGNVLVYHYYEQLQEFEKASMSFPEYLPSVIQAFDLRRELQRRDFLAAENERRREKREKEEQQIREQAERQGALERVSSLLEGKKYDEAERLLLAMREKNPSDPPVLFGLGQIELQRHNAAPAEIYFQGVIQHPKAPAWMVARSRLQLATVYLATERLPEARSLLQQLAQESGDIGGVQQEARKRLAGLPSH